MMLIGPGSHLCLLKGGVGENCVKIEMERRGLERTVLR